MSLHIGDTAPNFAAATTAGEIELHSWSGDSWVFFFSHPADFTPVCTTEMGMTAKLAEKFEQRNVKPLGLSTDTVEEHCKWVKDVDETQGVTLRFPIVADPDLKIARLYDMIHPDESETAAVRSVFIIDPQNKIRLTMTYPMSVGRNFDEILRVVDSLQTGDRAGIATPANWKPGEDVIIPPSVSDEEAREKFPQGFETIKPYLRTTTLG
ncbi:peroxiredoxin [Erythrobacter sp. SN021]|uniref:peroxiredoxin n=1 Tax=Erythrobacter sp. SN021 TaxID=2912574 RepID=UPI001F018AEB|nr:peroxiredoxin [Erythrobacter sp. SN021]MCF8883575.1 peroxiredoxin [Erythrobacter sp. SN021]